jgi:hypothetical protein
VKIKNLRLIICWVLKEIYENASGLGKEMLSGFTFQFSDGWWKYGKQKT